MSAFFWAVPGDDVEIRSLLRRCPLPGGASTVMSYDPDFFSAIEVEGDQRRVLLARQEGGLAACATVASRQVHVNGVPRRVGYLGSLRIDPRHRNSSILARGYGHLRRWHEQEGAVPYYLSTIYEDNVSAREILTSRRAGLPIYEEIGRYRTLLFPVLREPGDEPSGGPRVVGGEQAGLDCIMNCLQDAGRRSQFYPVYKPGDLAGGGGLLRGLSPRDFFVAFEGSSPVGAIACWDQSSFRQHVVTRYRGIYRVLHGLDRWLGWDILPRPGEPIPMILAACVAVDPSRPDVFAALLRQALRETSRRRKRYLAAGFFEGDPFLARATKQFHAAVKSRVYAVHFGAVGGALSELDGRPMCLELGSL